MKGAVTVEHGVYRPCGGCQSPTVVRVDGEPYHHAHAPDKDTKPRLGFLEALHDECAPRMMAAGRRRRPWWQPTMPEITDRVVTSTWTWGRDNVGTLAVLDRTAAYLSAASSVDVAHGALVHRPDTTSYDNPGFYKVQVHPWDDMFTPHPLGAAAAAFDEDGAVWVAHPRAQLLQRLADAGRYPDGFIVDAYTAPGVRLRAWTRYVQGIRADVISQHGRGEQYTKVKTAFSQAVAMMTGTWRPGQGRTYHETSRVHRPDWGMAIAEQSAVTLWSWCDDLAALACVLNQPELAPVAMRNVDEILVPLDAVPLYKKTPRTGGRSALPIDPDGIRLGTFKVKAVA